VLGIIHRSGACEKSQYTLKTWNRRATSWNREISDLPRVKYQRSYGLKSLNPVLRPTRPGSLCFDPIKMTWKMNRFTYKAALFASIMKEIKFTWGIGGSLIQIHWALHPIPIFFFFYASYPYSSLPIFFFCIVSLISLMVSHHSISPINSLLLYELFSSLQPSRTSVLHISCFLSNFQYVFIQMTWKTWVLELMRIC
jgi:hypothetical protein